MINIVTSSRYKVNKKALAPFADDLLANNGISPEKVVNIVFVGTRKMKEIANTYKHEDVALPVLAFPYKNEISEDNLFGEVIMCYPEVVLLAAERERKVDEMIKQLLDHGIKNLLK